MRMACTRRPLTWYQDCGIFDPSCFRKGFADLCFILSFSRILKNLLFHLESCQRIRWLRRFLCVLATTFSFETLSPCILSTALILSISTQGVHESISHMLRDMPNTESEETKHGEVNHQENAMFQHQLHWSKTMSKHWAQEGSDVTTLKKDRKTKVATCHKAGSLQGLPVSTSSFPHHGYSGSSHPTTRDEICFAIAVFCAIQTDTESNQNCKHAWAQTIDKIAHKQKHQCQQVTVFVSTQEALWFVTSTLQAPTHPNSLFHPRNAC